MERCVDIFNDGLGQAHRADRLSMLRWSDCHTLPFFLFPNQRHCSVQTIERDPYGLPNVRSPPTFVSAGVIQRRSSGIANLADALEESWTSYIDELGHLSRLGLRPICSISSLVTRAMEHRMGNAGGYYTVDPKRDDWGQCWRIRRRRLYPDHGSP